MKKKSIHPRNETLQGKDYWRSLAQLEGSPEFDEFLHREFPQGASELKDPVTRRSFLTLMGASIALAGLAGCRRPVEKIIPYVNAPEEIVPGIPKFYATSMPFGLSAYGLLVETHESRPTKLEGNSEHSSTQGASNAIIQGSILGLYDPDRARSITRDGEKSSFSDFVSYWQAIRRNYIENNGEGLAVISESYSSPTLNRLRRDFSRVFPRSKWVTYEPVSDENIFEGIRVATGIPHRPIYHFENAATVLSLDADFLLSDPENIANTQGFSSRRRVSSEDDSMNRLYVAESGFSLTGGMADHRIRLQSSRIGALAVRLARELDAQGITVPGIDIIPSSGEDSFDSRWLQAVAQELSQNRGSSLVLAGRNQPPAVHALVFAINAALGNNGETVSYIEPVDASFPNTGDLVQLADDIRSGSVTGLVILGGNPAYNAPADLDFSGLLGTVDHSVHISSYKDETSRLTDWHIPQSHYLESWGDVRSADGSLGVIQPMIAPLFDSYTSMRILTIISGGNDDESDYDSVRRTWRQILGNSNLENNWRKVLHDGILTQSTVPPTVPRIDSRSYAAFLSQHRFNGNEPGADQFELVFTQSQSTFDGRYANNGWLQELPDPVTKISWDNVALISPSTARSLELNNADVVQIIIDGRDLEIPVWIQPGQADKTVSVALGYGIMGRGRVADGVGANSYKIRASNALYIGSGLTLNTTEKTRLIATTQDHNSMENRPIVREASLEEYRDHPEFAPEMVKHFPLRSMWKDHSYEEGYQWGMSIDLNTCTGCNACTIACQSENNIPVVGKDQVSRGREMHWIRLDRYFSGDPDNPEMVTQPVACQHCENAPCEQVCPVAATVHDAEGLNLQVYNRCIGTRYCSNNCPYKVRRFNFYNLTKDTPELVKMAQNPDVTVRSRGVMEKCTFCLQRINRTKSQAKLEKRDVRDGEVRTACQETCPARAIYFGNINDPDSEVSWIKRQNRNYELLAELNNRPRNSYLAKIRNPNPQLR